jgi:hypothetical protein
MKKTVAKKMIENTIAMIRLSSVDVFSDSVNIAYNVNNLNTVDDVLGSCSTHFDGLLYSKAYYNKLYV